MVTHKKMLAAERLQQIMLCFLCSGITLLGISVGQFTCFMVKDTKGNSMALK